MADLTVSPPLSLSATAPLVTEIPTAMDPRLQRLLVRRQLSQVEAASVSSDIDEVAVLARVTDVAAWEGLSEVRIGSLIGQDSDGTFVVTGRIPVPRIPQVHAQPFVVSLKAARPLRPTLDATLAETSARPDLLPAESLADGGAGVIVGIVDSGCDFAHQNVRMAGGGTRLLSIWHQDGPGSPASPFGYGRKHSQTEINRALEQVEPYIALGYGPRPDGPGRPKGTHGTHVMDIAAGNGRGSNLPGVAPRADLIFVDVSLNDVPFEGVEVTERTLGDSVRLLEALKFIFEEAGNRPCVINVSLGTHGGPHDGSTLVEKGIDSLVRQAPNRAVVIAAANSFDGGIHATGQIPASGTFDLRWRIPVSDLSQNEMEIWFGGEDLFSVELLAPDGTSLLSVGPGESDGLTSPSGEVIVFIANRLADPNNGDNVIAIFLEEGLPNGDWTVRLRGNVVANGTFHAWIERDDFNPSQFAPPHDNSRTLGSISCGHETLVVGSYDAHKSSRPLSFFSSAGPTRDGRQKPEVSAPGHEVFAAHSRTRTEVVRKSGTSMAAPAVTGIVALMLGEARRRGIDLTNAQIRQGCIAAARRNPPAGTQWDSRYGHGRLSASAAVQSVIDLVSGGTELPGANDAAFAARRAPAQGAEKRKKPPARRAQSGSRIAR